MSSPAGLKSSGLASILRVTDIDRHEAGPRMTRRQTLTTGEERRPGTGALIRLPALTTGRTNEKEMLSSSPRMRPCDELRLRSRTVLVRVTVTWALQSPSLESLPNTVSDSKAWTCKLTRIFLCGEDLKTKTRKGKKWEERKI